MANTRTYIHDEHTIIDAKGNEVVMFHKSSVYDVVMDFKSSVTIDGKIVFSAVCETAGDVAEKVVLAPGFHQIPGAMISVYFKNGISATSPTLNVNNAGAVPIMLYENPLKPNMIQVNQWVIMRYNGTNFDVVGGVAPARVSKNNAKKFYLVGQESDVLDGVPNDEYYNTTVYIDASGKIMTAPFFEGDGSKLQNLNATAIKSGTLSASRLAESGVTPGDYGSSTNAALGFSDVITVPHITVDKYGRVTSVTDVDLTLPDNPDTDIKVTTTQNNSAKYYLAGTTTESTSTNTLVHNTGVYVSSNRLYAPSVNAPTVYLGSDARYISGTSYTGTAASVDNAGFATHLEDGLASTATNKAATANAARKLSAGITSLIRQLGTQATFSLSGTTLTITTKADPSVSLK